MPRVPMRALPSIAVLLLWLIIGTAEAGPLAGSVVGIAGQVSVDRSGQRYGLRLSDPVYVDDTFTVAAGAKLKLRMNDGSVLSLAPGTSLRIDAYALDASGRRLSVGQGLVRAATAPAGGPSNFEIDTAVGTSGARSTDWFVEAAPGSEQVAVLSGSVSLTSRSTGRGVLIPPGFGSQVACRAGPDAAAAGQPGRVRHPDRTDRRSRSAGRPRLSSAGVLSAGQGHSAPGRRSRRQAKPAAQPRRTRPRRRAGGHSAALTPPSGSPRPRAAASAPPRACGYRPPSQAHPGR